MDLRLLLQRAFQIGPREIRISQNNLILASDMPAGRAEARWRPPGVIQQNRGA